MGERQKDNAYKPEQGAEQRPGEDEELGSAQSFLDHLADSISEFARCSDATRDKFISLCSRFEAACAPLLRSAKAEALANRDGTSPPHMKATNTVKKDGQQRRIVPNSAIQKNRHVTPGDSGRVAALSRAGAPADEGDLLFSHMRASQRTARPAAKTSI
jgi:hypothetical protein